MSQLKQKKSVEDPVFSLTNKLIRVLWSLIYLLFFRLSPVPLFAYRRFILNILGAKISKGVHIYPSVKIWLPSNLSMDIGSTLGPKVYIYNQGFIEVGRNAIISQGAHLCASTHDYNNPIHPLVLAPIKIGNNVWICADAFIGPNVSVAEGGVIGARAVLNKNTKEWLVYAGNPAKEVNQRKRFN